MMMHIADTWARQEQLQSQGGTSDHMTGTHVLDLHIVHMHTL